MTHSSPTRPRMQRRLESNSNVVSSPHRREQPRVSTISRSIMGNSTMRMDQYTSGPDGFSHPGHWHETRAVRANRAVICRVGK